MRSRWMFGLRLPAIKTWIAIAASALVASCTLVDTVDRRADWMNESVARFRNQAILRNIIRSANDEPLSFGAISSIVGHNTSVNSLPALPGHNWGPRLPITHNLPSGTTQYNVSSDFTFNAIDDAGTYAALLTPLDAATIAAFTQRSGWQTNFLYLLFFSRITIADTEGRVLKVFNGDYAASDPRMCAGKYCGPESLVAYTLLAYLGLSFNFERGSVPGQAKKPKTQVCFERGHRLGAGWNDFRLQPTGGKIVLPAKVKTAKGKLQHPPSYCDEDGTWLPSASTEGGGTNNITCVNISTQHGEPDKKRTPNAQTTPVVTCAPEKKKNDGQRAAHYVVFDAQNNVWIELSTRSTWGIYQFLGGLANRLVNEKKAPIQLVEPGYPVPEELILLNIVKDGQGDCFVQVEDRGRYCVPNGAASRLTRISFVILHQLAALQTAVVNVSPSSSSVRITP